MPEGVDGDTTDNDILTILRYNIPIESIIKFHAFDQYILTVNGSYCLRQKHLTTIMLTIKNTFGQWHFPIMGNDLYVECF